jgi:rhodanese-related sulfurtransferase/rubrerythrin
MYNVLRTIPAREMTASIKTISIDEARELLEGTSDDQVLLDVREPKEYAQGHIPGATLMPLSALPTMMEKLSPDKPVITYCRSGKRSMAAASLLLSRGLDNVSSMDGGIMAWNGTVAVGSPDSGMFLLEGRSTPEDMLRLAWALEDGTRFIFESAKGSLPGPVPGVVLGALIKAEAQHQQNIVEAYRVLKPGATEDDIRDESVSGYMEGGTRLEEALKWLNEGERTPLDIIEASLLIESNSLDLYLKLSAAVEQQAVRDILAPVIEEEKTHLKSLGKLLQDLM